MSRRLWELLNSLWIILTFTYFTNWLAFIYIGITGRNRRWILYGVLYLLPFFITNIVMSFYVDPSMINERGEVTNSFVNMTGSLFMIPWLVSIGHAFYVRKEYLWRLKSLKQVEAVEELHFQRRLKEMKNAEDRNLRRKINKEYKDKYHELKNSDIRNNDEMENKISKKSSSLTVDINNDPEELMAELPGVGIILAKKAVKIRETSPFESLEEFGEALGLKPHILEQIRPSVVISGSEIKIQKSSRLVDV